MNREARTADLAVHGWIPVRDSARSLRRFTGVYHEQLDLCFACSRSVAGQHIVHFAFGRNPVRMWVECPWDDVSTEVLDAIDARLAEI